MTDRRKPGEIRDAILAVLKEHGGEATLTDVRAGVNQRLGAPPVPSSSVRSYLQLNSPRLFRKVGRGRYALRAGATK